MTVTRTTQIAVVGAGPAGIGAALAAARSGAAVVLIDEHDAPGGHLRWTMSRQAGFAGELHDRRGFEIAEWADRALHDAGVEAMTRTVAWGLFEENLIGVASEISSFQLRAESVIIATGATDIVWPFPGWELPGVLTATAALRSMHLDRVLPGRRTAVLSSGALAEDVASDIVACGGDVVARRESVDGVSAGGNGVVEWVNTGGDVTECDSIVLSLGRQPDCQLALQAQVAVAFAANDGMFVPLREETMMSSVANLYVVGDAAGAGSAARAFMEGTVAGEAASRGTTDPDTLHRLRSLDSRTGSPIEAPSFADNTLICRCEEVSARAIRDAIAGGAISINDVKRRTRAGMGVCQGVYCNRAVARMIAAEAGVAIESIGPMTARPPARLVSMAAMADLDQ